MTEHAPTRLGSDGLPALEMNDFTQQKHFFLDRYISIFTSGMRAKWARLVYIDLFAGPGVCWLKQARTEIDGSPLLALRARHGFTKYYFNDREKAFVDALRERAKRFPDRDAEFLNEDCNAAAKMIGRKLPTDSLCLAFIDPFSWEIAFESLAALTAQRRVDLIITFHSGNIKRAACYDPAKLTDFFGTPEWKTQYDSAQRSGTRRGTRTLLDCYESRLRTLGYLHVNDKEGIKNSRGTRQYHLILASKHERGKEFWEKVSDRNRGGQRRLL